MKKKFDMIAVGMIILLLLIPALLIGKKQYDYVGVKRCKQCHGEDAIGNQYNIWLASSHSRAYENLSSRKARKIALKIGIENPQSSSKCLRCHTTGRDRDDNRILEGVGCESCHGPGSEYHKPSVHVDLTFWENGYKRAVKSGMYHILGENRLKSRERMCLSCHDYKRPCYPEAKAERIKQKMTIQVVDSLMRGTANLRHPVRR